MALHNLTSLKYTYFPSTRPFFLIVKKKAYDITYHWVLYLSMCTVKIVVWKDLRETKDRWQWKLKCIQELSKTWTRVVGMWDVYNMCVFFVVVVVNFDNNAAKCISRQERSTLKKRCMVVSLSFYHSKYVFVFITLEQMFYVKNKDIRKWIIVSNTLNKSDIIN